MIVDNDDSSIRKGKDLNVGYFDDPFFSLGEHFLAVNTEVRTACPLSFIVMLVAAFFERHLSIVGEGYGENPNLDLKVTTVRVLPGLGFQENTHQKSHFVIFRERRVQWANDGTFLGSTIYRAKPFQ
jgi:hypothetical protein